MDHTLIVLSIVSTIFSQLFFSYPAGNSELKITPSISIFSRHLMFPRYASKAWFFPTRSIVDLFSLRFSPDTWRNFLIWHSTSRKSVLFLRKKTHFICVLYIFNRFKRIWTNGPESNIPFLTFAVRPLSITLTQDTKYSPRLNSFGASMIVTLDMQLKGLE